MLILKKDTIPVLTLVVEYILPNLYRTYEY
jgi:hypothetical protein